MKKDYLQAKPPQKIPCILLQPQTRPSLQHWVLLKKGQGPDWNINAFFSAWPRLEGGKLTLNKRRYSLSIWVQHGCLIGFSTTVYILQINQSLIFSTKCIRNNCCWYISIFFAKHNFSKPNLSVGFYAPAWPPSLYPETWPQYTMPNFKN